MRFDEVSQPYLEPTPENIARAKAFLMQKWKERAKERLAPDPVDLSSSCKFSSLFVRKVFGGRIRGNTSHQYVQMKDGSVIDLNRDSPDVKRLGSMAHHHDETFWNNPEHKEAMASCLPRVNRWVAEFLGKTKPLYLD